MWEQYKTQLIVTASNNIDKLQKENNEKFKKQNNTQLGKSFQTVQSTMDKLENALKQDGGCITKEQFQKKQNTQIDQSKVDQKKQEEIVKRKQQLTAQKQKLLSFLDDDENEEELQIQTKKIKKNPNADTEFLPDVERDQKYKEQYEEKQRKFKENLEQQKQEYVEFTFNYFGTKLKPLKLLCQKKLQISDFLDLAKKRLADEHNEFQYMDQMTPWEFICSIQDTIIQSDQYFIDMIQQKLQNDKGVELMKLEKIDDKEVHRSGVLLIVEKSRYESEKHIFPFNIWEASKLKL